MHTPAEALTFETVVGNGPEREARGTRFRLAATFIALLVVLALVGIAVLLVFGFLPPASAEVAPTGLA